MSKKLTTTPIVCDNELVAIEAKLSDVAALHARFPKDSIARASGTDVWFGVHGHWLYVQKCVPNEKIVHDGEVTLYRAEKAKQLCLWGVILAKGRDIGKRREGADWVRWKAYNTTMAHKQDDYTACARWTEDVYKIGDMVVFPFDHAFAVKHSPYNDFEFFIDEATIVCRADATPAEG